ncbi:hypothetical protein P8452_59684 [Trifolium repens]|nr:hypothetical protein P8452_59684 [Trifolium repens]
MDKNKNIGLKQNDSKRMVVKCVKGCPFHIRFSKRIGNQFWQLVSLVDDHNYLQSLQPKSYAFISDQQKGLVPAIQSISEHVEQRKWDLTGMPCCHVVACIWDKREAPEDYVSSYYRKSTILATYSHIVLPTNGKRAAERVIPKGGNKKQKLNEQYPANTQVKVKPKKKAKNDRGQTVINQGSQAPPQTQDSQAY